MSVTPAEVGDQEGSTARRPLDPVPAETTLAGRDAVHEHVLVTEQQVLFSTAASITMPVPKTWRWLDPFHRVAQVGRRLFTATAAAMAPQPDRPHYAPRSRSYYDASLNSRERGRL